MKIATAIKMYTGSTSQKPIIEDLVNVVARPIKNILLYSCFTNLNFFFKELKVKGSNNKNTTAHLQKAKEIGGTYSIPPLATIKLLAIKIGWINNNKKGK